MQVPRGGAPQKVPADTVAALKDAMSNLLTYIHLNFTKRRISTLTTPATGAISQKSSLVFSLNFLAQRIFLSRRFRNRWITLLQKWAKDHIDLARIPEKELTKEGATEKK